MSSTGNGRAAGWGALFARLRATEKVFLLLLLVYALLYFTGAAPGLAAVAAFAKGHSDVP